MEPPIRALQRGVKRSFHRAHRGLTLLTIFAFLMGLIFGPRVLALFTR